MKFTFRTILASLLSLLCTVLQAAEPTASPTKPNIVYLLADDLGYADCGFNGSKDIRTPHIDALAQSGMNLKSCYAQPVCSPARAALMTGRIATHTGVYTVILPGSPAGVPTTERMLPKALQECGYTTAICGKWHLGESKPEFLPMQRGFEHQYGHYLGNLDYFTQRRDGELDWYRDQVTLEEEGYTTDLIAKEACRIIDEQPSDTPLFLYVPFNAVHTPLQVPDSYKTPYQDLPEPRQTLAGMTAALDEAVGLVVQSLERKGMRKNTLIVFASDNGGSQPGKRTDNTPLRGGKGSLYEGGIRVCACAAWEGHIPAGSESLEPVHFFDWYPTFLKLAGEATKPSLPLDGHDIMPVLTQGAESPHASLLIPGIRPGEFALRMNDWKLIVTPKRGDNSQPPKRQLYNLVDDISEKHDLSASHTDKLEEMNARMNELIENALPDNGGMQSPTHDTRGKRKRK